MIKLPINLINEGRADWKHTLSVAREKLGAKPEQIKVKSAELDELGKIDLLSNLCPVRYIITKDALREGWDCPFAYILAVLSKTTAATALTQRIGRVLPQPEARLTTQPSLNEC